MDSGGKVQRRGNGRRGVVEAGCTLNGSVNMDLTER